MSKSLAASPFSDGEASVQFLSIECLRTTYSSFRTCRSPAPNLECKLKLLPLRVVATADGYFEIIDGFKRFASWIDEGRPLVPVVIESPGSRPEHKRLLLMANAPRRTLTPLDEACVVCSLLDEDGLTVSAIAKLLRQERMGHQAPGPDHRSI